MGVKGGYGVSALGRSEFGHAESVIEARFSTSQPVDKSRNNSIYAWIRFVTYCYSSWISVDDVLIEISEDNGASYSVAFDGTAFISPYNGANSRYFRPDGQRLVFLITKNGVWVRGTTVKIRFTGPDEYGQPATKEIPVYWPEP